MSEFPPHNPEHDRRQDLTKARRFDASFSDQLADALAARGDNKNAEAQREQAQRQRQMEGAKQQAEKYEQRPDLYRRARRLNTGDMEALAEQLEAKGNHEKAQEIREGLVEKANQPSQRQVKPPETK